ncbi:DolP-mannose mannosyltransferase [Haloplanus vescus]|uniref:DolP-mannose mannosyltransferase n=1 Tax=Haloplanus vescus TaxID=555874 RepID=A0A1H4AQK8_9EURY|nr:DolP-mannose mannosyltransferase [Haloplanus vescus]SEA38183.1 DolP-mannose mannosyltransferase [Haloplanus vescus]
MLTGRGLRGLKRGLSDDPWRLALIAATISVFAISMVRTALFSPTLINYDGAFYAHAGWYTTKGAIPYVTFWDVKPPLVFEWTALLAFFAFDNMLLLHAYHVATTSAVAAGSVLLVGYLTTELTESSLAGFCAGAVLLAYPGFHYLAAHGFRPKYFTLFFGLAALYLHYSGQSLASGVAAAAAAGFWQFGAVFPVVVLGLEYQRTRTVPVRALTGMAATTLVVVTPFVFWGAIEPMFVEVVVAPFLLSETFEPFVRLWKGFRFLGYLIPIVLIGAAGIVGTLRNEFDTRWWVFVVGTWYGLQIFYFDLDGFPDLFLGVAIVGIGFGLIVAEVSLPTQRGIVAVVVTVLFISGVFLGGIGLVAEPLTTTEDGVTYGDKSVATDALGDVGKWLFGPVGSGSEAESAAGAGPTNLYDPPDARSLYWNQHRPCHYFIGTMGANWIKQTDGRYVEMSCYE